MGRLNYPDPPVGPDDLPAGLDNFKGNLLVTKLRNVTEPQDPEFFVMDAAGTLVRPAVETSPITTGPLGVADSPEGIWLTDLADGLAVLNTLDGDFVRSFSTVPQTDSPEGIEFHPVTGSLFVVGGNGENQVFEYEPDGTFVAGFPINGVNQDGIAFDAERCSFWIYDSGTDRVRHYFFDGTAMTEQENFPGTSINGFSNGEGVAVIGDRLYAAGTGPFAALVFDISAASSDAGNPLCPGVFADGFETGDLSAWSTSVGGS
ncbi:MAG: hypothetical protein AAGM22_02955 [Acidobacteriota bacterium]